MRPIISDSALLPVAKLVEQPIPCGIEVRGGGPLETASLEQVDQLALTQAVAACAEHSVMARNEAAQRPRAIIVFIGPPPGCARYSTRCDTGRAPEFDGRCTANHNFWC